MRFTFRKPDDRGYPPGLFENIDRACELIAAQTELRAKRMSPWDDRTGAQDRSIEADFTVVLHPPMLSAGPAYAWDSDPELAFGVTVLEHDGQRVVVQPDGT